MTHPAHDPQSGCGGCLVSVLTLIVIAAGMAVLAVLS